MRNIHNLKSWFRSKPKRIRTFFRVFWLISNKRHTPGRYVSRYYDSGIMSVDYLPAEPARKLSWWLEPKISVQSGQDQQQIVIYVPEFSATTQEEIGVFLSNVRRYNDENFTKIYIFLIVADQDMKRKVCREYWKHRSLVLAIQCEDQLAAFRDILSFCSIMLVACEDPEDQKNLTTRRALSSGVGVALLRNYRIEDHLVSASQLRAYARRARGTVTHDLATIRESPLPQANRVHPKQNILVASHDLKFSWRIIDHLRSLGHVVRIDQWNGHTGHNGEKSQELLEWADIIWCEWALGNAVWYTQNKKTHQRLVVRFHAQELRTRFPRTISWETVNTVIFVSEHIRFQAIRDFDVGADKTEVIPNPVVKGEVVNLHASCDDRRFRLALVGFVPQSKGVWEALSVLEKLRRVDTRYRLTLRGKKPEEHGWIDHRPTEKNYFKAVRQRIEKSPLLKDGVDYSPFGTDMDDFYTSQGFILSTSANESFHYSIPDGATRCTVPVLFRWPGSDLLYPHEWIVNDTDEMVEKIRKINHNAETWAQAGAAAKQYVDTRYADEIILPEIVKAILGNDSVE